MQTRPERRLAAILAADVAGYSRLIGIDEEGTLGHLKAIRANLFDGKIAEYRGRIVKTTGRRAPSRVLQRSRRVALRDGSAGRHA